MAAVVQCEPTIVIAMNRIGQAVMSFIRAGGRVIRFLIQSWTIAGAPCLTKAAKLPMMPKNRNF